MPITVDQVVENVTKLRDAVTPAEFVYDFLNCFGLPKATIARLKSGDINLARDGRSLLLKQKLYFSPIPPASPTDTQALQRALDAYKDDPAIAAAKPRFVVVTDFIHLAALDRKTNDSLQCSLADLHEHYAFFLPLAGMERAVFDIEAEADVKAAEHMAKLYELIRADNVPSTEAERHALNVFLTRLLFCYFAEDTGIFAENAFTGAISQFTQSDGSDTATFLQQLFLHLNVEQRKANSGPRHLAEFPYVNGGLFNDPAKRPSPVPRFTAKSRRKLIELGTKSWKEINPDIFGSMFQGVVDDSKRTELGMHYTSVPNIMKVLRPLFLDELYEELEKAKGSESRLHKLLDRLGRVRLFDPACGSGNFLILAYKELRRLEMAVFRELQGLAKQLPLTLSRISVSQFFGIEVDDFACEVAVLALWLAEHQMNMECKAAFGSAPASLPLRAGAKIICGNATRLDWSKVCPKDASSEVYVMGNPPYYGARNMTTAQKADVETCFRRAPEHKDADYICCWFLKGAAYASSGGARVAFVATNSVCQGDHIAILWPRILDAGLEIDFAYAPFKWTNRAKGKAGVTCVIVGLRQPSSTPKWIYSSGLKTRATNINPYLANASNVIVGRREEPLSERLPAVMGSMARDGGHLILSREERDELIGSYPQAQPLIRPLFGSQEFIDGLRRWCLWIADADLQLAQSIPPIAERISKVFALRTASKARTTNGYANISHQFAQRAHKDGPSVMIPSTSSERRVYIPIAFFTDSPIITNLAYAIYDAESWLFALVSSKMHMAWARAVGGGLETRIRYSSSIVYNNFPFPELPAARRAVLAARAEDVLLEREAHPDKTIAELYDPDDMPARLVAAHRALDEAVERCYRAKPFATDEERLEHLFSLYEALTNTAPNA